MKSRLLLLLIVVSCLCACEPPEPPKPEWLLIAVNKSENSATILDRETGERIATLVTGVGPHEVAVHPASGVAVITNYGNSVNPGSSLTVVDLRTKRLRKTIGLRRFRRPHGIQFMSDGRRVAVTAEGNEALIIVNIDSGEIEKVIPTNQSVSHMVVLSPDEKRAYVTNIESGSLSVLNLEDSQLLRNMAIGKGAEGIDISPDGREIWIANRAEDTIAILDTQTLEVVEKIECGSFPIRVRFLPDSQHVMVSNARTGDIAVFSRFEREELRRVPMELTAVERENRLLDFDLSPVPIGIVVDPAGEKAFVANSNADIISVIDLKSWQVISRLVAGEEPDGMGVIDFEPILPTTADSSTAGSRGAGSQP